MIHVKPLTSRRFVLGAAAVCAALALTTTTATAAVPSSMVVEGFLNSTGGGAAADGVYDVTFAIYNVQSGGTAAWIEGPIKVAVKGGQFTHVLGAVKPLTAAILDKLSKSWLGMKVASDPELPRQMLRAVSYALLADTAKKVACSGCITGGALASGAVGADKVGFTFAGAKTKGGPANVALDLQCTACVTVAELKIDKDLDLGGNALKAKTVAAATVSATTFQGDGSKLTGIKTPAGECKVAGEVVKGINPDGSLKCIKAMDPKALPADGIDEISNFLIHNQFQNSDCIPKAVPIKDNNPIGVSSTVTFGDYGLAQKLDVLIDLKNSDLKSVVIKLWDPANTEYLLWDKTSAGNSLSGVWPSKTKVLKGDLTKWVGKNPKGKWRIQVIDTKFLNNASDGAVNKFCINIQTLSNKKIKIQGDLLVKDQLKGVDSDNVNFAGGVKLGDDTGPCNEAKKGTLRYNSGRIHICNGHTWSTAINPATYRWAIFDTYQNGQEGWIWGNDANMFAGVHPSQWTDGNYSAGHMSSDKEKLRTLFNKKGYANWNANVWADVFFQYSSTTGKVVMALFRVRNSTKSNITWKATWRYTAYSGWNEYASVAVNGSNKFHGNCGGSSCGRTDSLVIPANRVSTVIFVSTSSQNYSWGYSIQIRKVLLGFYNNSLKLPAGLEFVDDLDTAANGWNN